MSSLNNITMKSTFDQLTVAELKKKLSLGYKLMTYQLESGVDFAIPPIFQIYERKTYLFEPFLNLVVPTMYQSMSLREFKKNEKEKIVKEIVKQILQHHKSFTEDHIRVPIS